MRKLIYILFIILIIGCSGNETLKNTEPYKCEKHCVLNSVRVTITGEHLVFDTKNVIIDCDKDTSIFNIKRNNDGRILHYQVYRCN